MRTTVGIDDHILAAAKQEARRRGMTLGGLVEAALGRELARRGEMGTRPAVPVFRGGQGLRPGIDVTSNRAILEALDDDRTLEQLR